METKKKKKKELKKGKVRPVKIFLLDLAFSADLPSELDRLQLSEILAPPYPSERRHMGFRMI